MDYEDEELDFRTDNVSMSLRFRLMDNGYVDVGIIIYKKGIEKELREILGSEDQLLIFPERNSKTSRLKTRLCLAYEFHQRCQFGNFWFNAHGIQDLRKFWDPISIGLLRAYSRFQPFQVVTIFKKFEDHHFQCSNEVEFEE